MPPRKNTKEETPSDKEPATKESASNADLASSTSEDSPKKDEINEENESGQLFFSTDGSESEKEEKNPYIDEEEANKTKPVGNDSPEKVSEKPTIDDKKDGGHQPSQGNKPHRGQNSHPSKKQNWQDKRKQRNKSRQKFKKPKRLPYEETEAKPLELGELLDNESIQSLDGITTLAEDFNSSNQKPIELDELLALSLQELKEAVVSFELNLGQAPLREEIIDALLAQCLEDKLPVLISGIIQVMEDGHAFLLQQNEDYRLKSQCPFIPEPLVKKFGLKTGQNVCGYIRAKLDGSTCPVLLQVEKVMNGDPEEASRLRLLQS